MDYFNLHLWCNIYQNKWCCSHTRLTWINEHDDNNMLTTEKTLSLISNQLLMLSSATELVGTWLKWPWLKSNCLLLMTWKYCNHKFPMCHWSLIGGLLVCENKGLVFHWMRNGSIDEPWNSHFSWNVCVCVVRGCLVYSIRSVKGCTDSDERVGWFLGCPRSCL